MDTATLIVDEFSQRQLLEDSPYFEGIKFCGMPVIHSDRLNDLVAKDIREHQLSEINDKDKFIEFWQTNTANRREVISIEDDDESGCEGPLNAILQSFKSHSKHSDDNDDSPFSCEGRRNAQSYQLDDIISCSERNFEDVINEECRWVEVQHNSIEMYNQVYQDDNRDEQENEIQSNVNESDGMKRSKQNKRDKKLCRKLYSGKIRCNKLSEVDHKHNASRAKVEKAQRNNSDLIIKISCGSDKNIGGKKSDMVINHSVKTEIKQKHEVDEKNVNDCSSSISTSGKEKDEAGCSSVSDNKESLIELDIQTKIFCRAVGPLSADQRRIKVLHYFDKKRSRTWTKRINYTTRKQVADVRPRYKGRFVTEEQFQAFDEMERHKKEMKALQKVFIITKSYPISKYIK